MSRAVKEASRHLLSFFDGVFGMFGGLRAGILTPGGPAPASG
jgi:hypothetical protein